MSQRNYKMLAIWDRSYQSLEQLRTKYGSFANVVQQLIDNYYEKQQQQEPCSIKESSQVGEGVCAPPTMTREPS